MIAQAELVQWQTSLHEAQEQAALRSQAILLDFCAAPACRGCAAMDAVTYAEPRVARFIAQHFLPVRVHVKEEPHLVEDYFAVWTPLVLIADEVGAVHQRLEGYLTPDDFIARLALGLGRYWLHRQEFARAAHHFEAVTRRHRGSDAGAEALYWLGVAQFKQSADPTHLRSSWAVLGREYPTSEWTRRSQIPDVH
jgi:hypothetical protein